MALKPDRDTQGSEDITYIMNEEAEKGSFVSIDTGASGVAMDNPDHVATVAAAATGARPLGVLMTDVESTFDRTVNFQRSAGPVGGKVNILRRGWVVTNFVTGTPAPGDDAVLAASGYVTSAAPGAGTAGLVVGSFDTSVDENGFARVRVNL